MDTIAHWHAKKITLTTQLNYKVFINKYELRAYHEGRFMKGRQCVVNYS